MKRLLFKSLMICLILTAIFSAYILLFEYYPLTKAFSLYGIGRYDDAIRKYNIALSMHPDSDVLNFNLGAALYKKGDYQKAAEFFSRVTTSVNTDLKQKAHYNIANCRYRSGEKAEGRNMEEAARFYRESLDYYIKATTLNLNDEDAKYNKRLAEKKVKDIADRPEAKEEQIQGDNDKSDTNRQDLQKKYDPQNNRHVENKNIVKPETKDDLKEKGSEKGKGTGRTRFKKGEMSREEAELLLEEFRKNEQAGSMLTDKAKRGHYPEVEKDW